MKKLYTITLVLALVAAAVTATASHAALAPDTNAGAIGATIEDFKLPDASGKEHSLAHLKGKNGTILIFVSVQCPISNAYNARMAKLAKDYAARGINVVGINSNVAETPDAIKRHAEENGLAFTILKDKGNVIADRLGAGVTPEVYFLDASNKLVYRGRIDNSRDGSSITSNDLNDAVEAVLAGRQVAKPEARAFGCSIKRA
jgi:peroxiredoxin